MNHFSSMLIRFSATIIIATIFTQKASSQFSYLNPRPGSQYHNPQTTLAIRSGTYIAESSVLDKNFIEITGSKSGIHRWTARLSDDRRTIVVKPQSVFEYDETVSVTIHSNELRRETGEFIEGTAYSFGIRPAISTEQAKKFSDATHQIYMDEFGFDPSQQSDVRDENIDSLPTYTIGVNNNATPGQIFFGNSLDFDPVYSNCFAAIIENDGSVVWARDLGTGGHDFKINLNGYLTYFNYYDEFWMIMDSNYKVIDSIQCGNGFGPETDAHDIAMYPDGHTFVIGRDERTVDMTPYGGQPDATVTGMLLQELDANKDVIFEWNGWDHFELDDAGPTVQLTNDVVDPIHPNSIERDNDGNILLSSRHLNEVSKINSQTGEFIWRLNGENNQFTFVNDVLPNHFTYQHDFRRIANGHVTLFNNGNYQQPARSSAKEYQLDEVNRVATLVWHYEHPDVGGFPLYANGSGNVQRLPNGNTFIDWGHSGDHPRPSMTEIDANKNIVWELTFDELYQKCYRAHRFTWNPCEMPKPDHIKVKKITSTSVKTDWNPVNNATSYDVQYRKLGNASWKLKGTTSTSKALKNLKPEKSYEFQVRTHCLNGYTSDWTPADTFTTLPMRLLYDEKEIVSLQLYPNPTSGLLNLEIETEQAGEVTLSVYDISGKMIFTSSEAISSGEQTLQFDLSDLHPGIYFAEVKTQSGSETIKFVRE